MAKITTTFTSESVCAGHPDKICDQISDAILDSVLSQDKHGRTAIETLATKDRVIIAGEINTKSSVNFEKIAQEEIKRLGYTDVGSGFSHKSTVDVYVQQQSDEIAVGVDKDGAGDQGMMFGFATNETDELMPTPILFAHRLSEAIDTAREKKTIPYLRPDGKNQITVGYKNGKPVSAEHIVVAVPHDEKIKLIQVREDVLKKLITPLLEEFKLSFSEKNLIVNGTGVWHNGGPSRDAGLTGRKIVVDTYGGYARVGGGAFSGKDPTKVDRSGAYSARYIAKNIVAHGLAEKAEVSLAYFIGAKKAIKVEIQTFGTAKKSNSTIKNFADKLIDTSVSNIINTLELRNPIYRQSAAYGHFGREIFPWEKISNI